MDITLTIENNVETEKEVTVKLKKPFKYNIPFYNFTVYLVTDVNQYNKLNKKLGYSRKLISGEYNGLCNFYDDSSTFIISVFDNDLGTLVHELAHLMIYLYEFIGSKINEETTEPFAYQIGDMFNIFKEELRKMNWVDL